MFRFENPDYLYLLALLLVMALGFWLLSKRRKKAFDKLGGEESVRRLMPDYQPKRATRSAAMLLGAFAMFVMALANPQMGTKTEALHSKGFDFFLVLDVSQSMYAQDVEPSRLDRAKQFARKLLNRNRGNRSGLILMAGAAYPMVPLTADFHVIESFLQTASPDMVPSQGTVMADAINLAVKSFETKAPQHRAVVIISDGEDHEAGAESAASAALKSGVSVFTIGVGGTTGAPVPIKNAQGNVSFLKDAEGNEVSTKMNPTYLAAVASAGGGSYNDLSNSDAALSDLSDQLERLEKAEIEVQNEKDFQSWFQIPLALALLLLAAEFLLQWRRK